MLYWPSARDFHFIQTSKTLFVILFLIHQYLCAHLTFEYCISSILHPQNNPQFISALADIGNAERMNSPTL